MKNKQKFLFNGLLLALVSLLMRTISVSFNVYVSGLVGAQAMGLIALISGVYGFAVTLATSGIHLATVRTISARLEQTKGAENSKCLHACLRYAAFSARWQRSFSFFLHDLLASGHSRIRALCGHYTYSPLPCFPSR